MKRKNNILVLSALVLLIGVFAFSVCFVTEKIGISKVNAEASNINNSFDDDNFANCVLENYNANNNTNFEELTDKQLSTLKTLSCSGRDNDINSVVGIEKMTNLTYLNIHDSNLKSIDLTYNTKLETLSLYRNHLENINLDKNIEVKNLYLYDNEISNINLTKNIKLIDLKLSYNELKNIDLTKNLKLENIYLDNNNLNTIDISKNVDLETLNLYNNTFQIIDLTKNINLLSLNIANNDLTNLDVSSNIKLKELKIHNNQLNNISLFNNKYLEILSIYNNNLVSLDLTKNANINQLLIYNNSYKLNKTISNKDKIKFESLVNLPKDLANDFSYESNNKTIATVDSNGIITPRTNGIVAITKRYKMKSSELVVNNAEDVIEVNVFTINDELNRTIVSNQNIQSSNNNVQVKRVLNNPTTGDNIVYIYMVMITIIIINVYHLKKIRTKKHGGNYNVR